MLEANDGTQLRRLRGAPRRAVGHRRRDPPRRPRPLPLLRGARAALRRARLRRDRDRLLRPHGGRREARRRLRVQAARRANDARRRAGRHRAPPSSGCASAAPRTSSPSASASAAATRGWRRQPTTASPARSASTAAPPLDGTPATRWKEAPILALQAGADQNITAEDNAAFDEALTEAGVEHEVVTYEGAPHSFFDRKQEDFAEASADAWQRDARVHRAATEADAPPAARLGRAAHNNPPKRKPSNRHQSARARSAHAAVFPVEVRRTSTRSRSEGPGRQSGPRFMLP